MKKKTFILIIVTIVMIIFTSCASKFGLHSTKNNIPTTPKTLIYDSAGLVSR